MRVYEAPNTDPGFADAFFAAASDNTADTVSTSWGYSESFIQQAIANGTEAPAYAAVFDEVCAELGAQGQSAFAASGDSGAYGALDDAKTTNVTVDAPAASPLITAAGGTTLPGVQTYPETDPQNQPTVVTDSVNIPTERTWSWDYLWPLYRTFGAASEAAIATYPGFDAGDGGGYSTVEPRPTYQSGISTFNDRPYFTPTDNAVAAPGLTLPTAFLFNPTPALQAQRHNSGRGLPDVSTNADPATGYAVYDPALFGGDGFVQYGGTSFVSPQLNGATAAIDSYLGHRAGFWNPQIYQFATSSTSPFTPLSSTRVYAGLPYLYRTANDTKTALVGEFSNNNLYYSGTPGALWNPASGLGVPNLTALAEKFSQRR